MFGAFNRLFGLTARASPRHRPSQPSTMPQCSCTHQVILHSARKTYFARSRGCIRNILAAHMHAHPPECFCLFGRPHV